MRLLVILGVGLAACSSGTVGPSGTDGGGPSGDAASGDPANGDPANGDPANGDPANGDPANGDPANGDPANGDPASGGDPGVSCVPSLPTFADGKTPSTTVYVQAGASGGNGSSGSPFGALSAGLAAAAPGTEVRVSGALADSTYSDGQLTGNANDPIWITGTPGAHIGPLSLVNASHVIVQDLEISSDPTGHVLHFWNTDHLMMRRLRIHDAGLGCIKGSQTTHAYVEDSELWDAGNNSSHPILDFVGVNDGHIIRSEFHQGPGVMIMLKGGTSDLLFAWNEVHTQEAAGNVLALGQSTGPQFFQPIDRAFEGLRIIAFANVLHDLVGAPVAFEGCKDCAAIHNTAWNTTGAQLVRFLPGAAGQDSGETVSKSEGCRFAGNIIVGGQSGGASLNADTDNVGPNNVIDYNVFLKPGNLNWWGVIAQDTIYSTYDEDPQLSSAGVAANTSLVDGNGPPDLGALPFADKFVRDYSGACFSVPGDLGALQLE